MIENKRTFKIWIHLHKSSHPIEHTAQKAKMDGVEVYEDYEIVGSGFGNGFAVAASAALLEWAKGREKYERD